MKLFEYFETQFLDLKGAAEWYFKWRNEWNQDIPGYPEFSGEEGYTLRSMAGHVSWYLENNDEDSYHGDYSCTKYGSDFYFGVI